MDLKEIVARNVRRLRHEKKLSQEELADRASMSSKYVSLIERGVHAATVTMLGSLADALDVEPSELLEPPARHSTTRKPVRK